FLVADVVGQVAVVLAVDGVVGVAHEALIGGTGGGIGPEPGDDLGRRHLGAGADVDAAGHETGDVGRSHRRARDRLGPPVVPRRGDAHAGSGDGVVGLGGAGDGVVGEVGRRVVVAAVGARSRGRQAARFAVEVGHGGDR